MTADPVNGLLHPGDLCAVFQKDVAGPHGDLHDLLPVPATDSSFGSGALFSSSFIVLLFPAAYGLHRPQGLYPCSSSSSLVPLNSFLFSGPISSALEQAGAWNFIVFVLRIYSFSS